MKLDDLPGEIVIKIQYHLNFYDCFHLCFSNKYLYSILYPNYLLRFRIPDYPELIVDKNISINISDDSIAIVFEMIEYDYDRNKGLGNIRIDTEKHQLLKNNLTEFIGNMIEKYYNVRPGSYKPLYKNIDISVNVMPTLPLKHAVKYIFAPILAQMDCSSIDSLCPLLMSKNVKSR